MIPYDSCITKPLVVIVILALGCERNWKAVYLFICCHIAQGAKVSRASVAVTGVFDTKNAQIRLCKHTLMSMQYSSAFKRFKGCHDYLPNGNAPNDTWAKIQFASYFWLLLVDRMAGMAYRACTKTLINLIWSKKVGYWKLPISKFRFEFEMSKMKILKRNLKSLTATKQALLIDEMNKINQNSMKFFIQSFL